MTYREGCIPSSGHPAGGIVAKNYGSVKNCVAVLELGENVATTYVGGVAGFNSAGGNIQNCYSITSSAVNAISASQQTGGTATNCADYATLAEFYAEVMAFADWTFDSTNKTANPYVNKNCTITVKTE